MALRLALAQFDSCVGDFESNIRGMSDLCRRATTEAVELLVFPELAVCGYPPEDLLLKQDFLQRNHLAVRELAAASSELTVVVGFAEYHNGKCYNSAAVLQQGCVLKTYRKCRLPNYGVFDEQRYFAAGCDPLGIQINDIRLALSICEDTWQPDWLPEFLKLLGPVDVLLNISASPFHMGKTEQRRQLLSDCARKLRCCVAYCNIVGGQDELVFDGRSMIVDSAGAIVAQAAGFAEDLLVADIIRSSDGATRVQVHNGRALPEPDVLNDVYRALVLGARDYVRKNGFTKVLVGLSGGVDSAVTAAVAAAALGPENIIAVTMPSRFNSPQTISDAQSLAENLGIKLLTIPIGPVLERFDESLRAVRDWNNSGIAYENLQARIRGCILMSLSNQMGCLVLTTGNKSETAVGYATLYGDTAGGFAVIKDVPKTLVYRLAEHINRLNHRQVIPRSVLDRAPSAELRPNQRDTDTLPEYEVLDRILVGYVEQDKSARQLVAEENLPADVVNYVIRLVDRSEYKRRQSPPGVKITPKAFGKDRRLPITNRYHTQA
jgi:NAD+ synthase (glutamine-hydrolysing)